MCSTIIVLQLEISTSLDFLYIGPHQSGITRKPYSKDLQMVIKTAKLSLGINMSAA